MTAVLAVLGSLEAITSFASLSFIVVSGAMSYLAVRQRDREGVNPVPPAVGAVGATVFSPLMLWHLYRSQPGTFYTVVALAVAVVGVELLYFERERIEREVEDVEETALDDAGSVSPDVE